MNGIVARVLGRRQKARLPVEHFTTPLSAIYDKDPLLGMTPSEIRDRVRDEALASWRIVWTSPTRLDLTRGDEAMTIMTQRGMTSEEQLDAVTSRVMDHDRARWQGASYPADVYRLRRMIDA
jgi:hypothetical protein